MLSLFTMIYSCVENTNAVLYIATRYLSSYIVLRYNIFMAKTPIQKSEYVALADFRYTLRQFMHFSEEAAEKAGVTPQQHQALLAIIGFPNREQITIGEL